jgi:predicted MPP superfamily phosphohydrolase
LGTVRAATHLGPLDFEILLAEIDIADLERTIGEDPTLAELTDSIERDLRDLARGLTVRLLLFALAAGAVVAAILPRRRPANFVGACAGSSLLAVLVIALAARSFDETAFEQPRFTGALRRAPQVIEAANRGLESFEALGSRYEALAQRLSQFLAVATDPELEVQAGAVAILHVSDIHSNALGIEFVTRLARAFDVDAVIDTGDLTSFGEPVEVGIAQLVRQIPVPYLFVPGNHDSASNRAAIRTFPGVSLLDGETEDVGGVEVLGWADPTFTADDETSTEEGNELRLQAADDVLEAVTDADPEILAVHDARLASESYGEVPIVLAGHTHERAVEEVSGTIVLTVGSAGATGLGSFAVETDLPYEAEILYLRPGAPLVVDYVSLSGVADEFDVERRIIDVEDEVGAVRHPRPSVADTGLQAPGKTLRLASIRRGSRAPSPGGFRPAARSPCRRPRPCP